MNMTIIKIDNIRPTSLEAPKISPVVYLKLLLVIKTMMIPAIIPPIIPRIPIYLKAKNPKVRVKATEIISSFPFIFSIKYCPVPLSNGFEKVAQLIKLILAAISETKRVEKM